MQILKILACRFFVFWVTPPIIVTLAALGFPLRSGPILRVACLNNRVARNLSRLLGLGEPTTHFDVPGGPPCAG